MSLSSWGLLLQVLHAPLLQGIVRVVVADEDEVVAVFRHFASSERQGDHVAETAVGEAEGGTDGGGTLLCDCKCTKFCANNTLPQAVFSFRVQN